MAHIHEKIDFTVAIFVVEKNRVLLIHHRKLDKWLPLGGHVELDEDPEQAALREAREESGLEVELLGERPPTTGSGTRALIAPRFLDIHQRCPRRLSGIVARRSWRPGLPRPAIGCDLSSPHP